ncbi:hypothetical protein TNCV_729861, partial [Trichonephila clavipes]
LQIMSVTRPRPVVPEELPKLLHSISYAVIKNQPQDIISFAADHFRQLYEDREQQKETAAKEAIEREIREKEEDNMLTKYQIIKFIDFCEVWYQPESVARVATIVGDPRCPTPRH